MTVPNELMPEAAFLKSLETLESLAKGVPAVEEQIIKGEADDLDNDDDKNDDDDDGGEGGLEKSGFAAELVDGSENIQKAVEVSDFLSDLVLKIGEAVDDIRVSVADRLGSIEKSLSEVVTSNQNISTAVSDTLRKSFQAVSEKTDLQAEQLQKSLADLDAAMSKVPASGVKSRLNVLEKGFAGSDPAPADSMGRSDILKSLVGLFESGNPAVTSMDILRFESNGVLSPHIRQLLTEKR